MRSPSCVGARPRPRSLSRLRRALLPALLLLAAGPPTAAFAYDDAGYLAYADRMQTRLDSRGLRHLRVSAVDGADGRRPGRDRWSMQAR